MKSFLKILVLGGLLPFAAPGWAATATTTFGVSGTVVPGCTISAVAMSFGTTIPNPILTVVDATSTITATCSTGAAYTLALNAGTGPGATLAARIMTGGGFTMSYSLFTTAARTTVWGDGTAGSATVPGTGTGAATAHTVFGRIPLQTVGGSAALTDSIIVTITF